MRRRETYRELILDNICYDALLQSSGIDKSRLDELVELIIDTVCSKREMHSRRRSSGGCGALPFSET